MRTLFLTLTLGLAALGLVAMTPARASAQWVYQVYPTPYAPMYYYQPPVYYPGPVYSSQPYFWTGRYSARPYSSGWYTERYYPWTNQYYYQYRTYPWAY